MEEDIRWRASKNDSMALSGSLDPYDNILFMPLTQFLDAPIVQELLHNGAALQVKYRLAF
jgi:hypothetical protein